VSPLKYRKLKTKYIVVFDGRYKEFVYLITHQTQRDVIYIYIYIKYHHKYLQFEGNRSIQ